MAASTVSEYNKTVAAPLQEVATTFAAIIETALPGIDGRVWHGHPVWLDEQTPIAGYKAYPSYVTFMIWHGQDLLDAVGSLEPAGSQRMATIKAASLDDVDEAKLAVWVREAYSLENE